MRPETRKILLIFVGCTAVVYMIFLPWVFAALSH